MTRDRSAGRAREADAGVERNGKLLVGLVVDFPNGSPHLVEITQLPCLVPEGFGRASKRVAAPDNCARENLNAVQVVAYLEPTRLLRCDPGSWTYGGVNVGCSLSAPRTASSTF